MRNQFIKDADNLVSILIQAMANGWTTDLRIAYVRQVLPVHYEVKESKYHGGVHCKSVTGISDDEHWQYFMQGLKSRFTDFLEVYHTTCYNHVDFTIYFKTKQP